MKQAVTFYSEGCKLSGDLYLPEGLRLQERRAGIVLCHGYTGVKDLYLPDNARVLNAAGYVVLTFDYKGWGASEGPRSRLAPYSRVADVQAALDDFKKQHYPDDASYKKALADYGLSEKDVFNQIAWQRTLLTYIDIRFRPSVQVTDQEINDYFQKVIKPAAEAAHPGQAVTLDAYREQIEAALAGKKVDDELNRWLAQAKQRIAIIYRDEAFQ